MVSDVQERQLVMARPGVRAFAVDGDFDACQRMVKQAFADPELRATGITSANSINVGRLLPQMIYYLWGVARLMKDEGVQSAPWIVVPSGNLGNLTAGMMAAASSMPAAGFLAAHNANPFFADVLAGRRDRRDRPATVETLSNAMDVGAPSNFERLHAWWGDALSQQVRASTSDDESTLAAMTATWRSHGTLVCPHTAVGLDAATRARQEGWLRGPAIVVATAHPAKFPAAVERATGERPPAPAWLDALMRTDRQVTSLSADGAALKQVLLGDA
jgi:threonine synthase